MTAVGQQQTSSRPKLISALPPKADIAVAVRKQPVFAHIRLAGAGGFEPPNAGIKNRCLSPLGYAPKIAISYQLSAIGFKYHFKADGDPRQLSHSPRLRHIEFADNARR